MKIDRGIRTFAAASALLAGLAGAQPAVAQVKIGFVATFTGFAGALGRDMYDGFMLGVEHLGGRMGGQPVEVIREDDQLKPELGVQIVQRLIEKDQVKIIAGVTFSNVMTAIYPRVVGAEVFLVSTNAGPAHIAGKQCSPFFFSTSWQNDEQHETMGKYAQDQGYKRMIIMAPNYQAGKEVLDGFKRYYKGTVIDELYPKLGEVDYNVELTEVQAKKPDAVFVFFPGGMGINFVKQWKQIGLSGKIPLLSGATVEGTTLPALGDDALGVKLGTAWGPDLPNAANQKFVSGFEAKYGRIPSQYAAQSYDGAMLIDSALKRTGGSVADKRKFAAAMRAADFKAIRGDFKINKNGFPIQSFYLFEIGKDAKGRTNIVTKGEVFKQHVDSYAKECPL
jgi:branched-chain amino acid transport system substrate-binding protein